MVSRRKRTGIALPNKVQRAFCESREDFYEVGEETELKGCAGRERRSMVSRR